MVHSFAVSHFPGLVMDLCRSSHSLGLVSLETRGYMLLVQGARMGGLDVGAKPSRGATAQGLISVVATTTTGLILTCFCHFQCLLYIS